MQRKTKVFLGGIGSNYPPSRGVAFRDGALAVFQKSFLFFQAKG